MELSDSLDLFNALERLALLENSPPLWWPKYGTFEVVIGAILTQNTQWNRVQISLENLRKNSLLDVESLCLCDHEVLMELIHSSGLFKAKAANLIRLSQAIMEKFGCFEEFSLGVTRDWLLSQKGIGPETADSILCYACGRDTMVIDSYTARLLNAFGYEFESYDELQAWCERGIRSHFDESQLSQIFAHFHGMIVEYVKRNSKGKNINMKDLNETKSFKTVFIINFLVIEYLALTPQHIEVMEGLWDKQNHFIAFFVLFILLSFSNTQLSTLKKFGLLLLMGFQIEAMQYFIPGRFFSLMDIVADSIGIMIAITIYHYGLKRYFSHWFA